jgi:NADPH2:quinone reductase
VREITGGVGVDVAYDGVGKDTFDASLAALKTRGMLVLFGAASGPVPPFDLQRLNAGGSLFVTRPSLGHYLLTRAEFEWRANDIFNLIAAGQLSVDIGATFSLDNAAAAHDALEGRKTTGKVLLIP